MRALSLLACAAALLFSGAAHAQDFTFTIPVRIENMRAMDRMQVICRVYTERGGTEVAQVGTTPIFPVTGGAYTGTLTVTSDLIAGRRRDEAGHYFCHIYFWVRDAEGRLVAIASDNDAYTRSEYQRITGQEITSSSLYLRGSIPPP